jgi:hypothetical protein
MHLEHAVVWATVRQISEGFSVWASKWQRLERPGTHASSRLRDGPEPTADIARSRKRALKPRQAAVPIAAKGRRNTHQQGENGT